MSAIGRDQRDIGRIAPQEFGFAQALRARADDAHRPVGHFVTVADRAIAQQPPRQRLVMECRRHRRAPVDHARRQQDGSRADRAVRSFSPEIAAVRRQRLDLARTARCAIKPRLLAHAPQQVFPRDPVRKPGMIVAERNKPRPASSVIHDENRKMIPRQINRRRQPGRTAADDEAVE